MSENQDDTLISVFVFSLQVKVGVWRSLVARLLWEQDVAGSNPVTPTSSICCKGSELFVRGIH